ncbi:hypothetical protein GUITHDRAFT_84776 [Guillardia theta CCMP2712]|uniref:Ribosomal RNA-processing protein 8 n=1 Tax=Guillardia theta (strain CCMP2712) TaxID=905079 RepID=L1JVI9_GUITC|nr:hypothetical protein GUITHDRAFT_84776 [Guillardia theta CCMP2712]EKX52220.1 hypothetical protein GUITHDRAFT_84776 [Guillardia theta CCMP2712]|eukprot:XP_005839200.1 hypothetical protein GUITHDRAFT_84776 [Guillardia theta CCMP2712]
MKMFKKLQGSHFRMLNEELYSTSSQHAVSMMKTDPSLFDSYHEGFREQTKKWPVNPVNVIIKYLKKYPKWKVADLGCGDAQIAKTLPNKVHSFDLISKDPCVVACDIAHVPLKDSSVNAVVLSLALMGTNYVDFLKEAHRIVVKGGKVLVAEVRSRLEHVLDEFVEMLKEMGFVLDNMDKSNKMFVMFYLTKNQPCAAELNPPSLKACQYKKR